MAGNEHGTMKGRVHDQRQFWRQRRSYGQLNSATWFHAAVIHITAELIGTLPSEGLRITKRGVPSARSSPLPTTITRMQPRCTTGRRDLQMRSSASHYEPAVALGDGNGTCLSVESPRYADWLVGAGSAWEYPILEEPRGC